MATEFTIQQVSTRPPEAWQSSYGPMEKYKVIVNGYDDPVALNRKPGNRPQVGESLYGTVESTPYGLKFNREDKPQFANPSGQNTQSGKASSTYVPRDDKAIQAQWAIGQAVQISIALGRHEDLGTIESLAKDMFSMIDRVKDSKDLTDFIGDIPDFPTDPPEDLRPDGTFGRTGAPNDELPPARLDF